MRSSDWSSDVCSSDLVGRSTAGAILAQAWGDRFAILDGNVKRVLCRHRGVEGWPGLPKVEKVLWEIAQSQLPSQRLADYTQAQMDFGATLCTRHDPACVLCPLQRDCVALADRKSTRLNSSHSCAYRMPSSD